MTFWKTFEQRSEDRIEVNDRLGHQLLARIVAPKSRVHPLRLLQPIVALAIVAGVAVGVQHFATSTNPTEPSSFIQQALAASESVTRFGDDMVRVMVFSENKDREDGIRRTIWVNADGTKRAEIDEADVPSEHNAVDSHVIFVNGQQYTLPSQLRPQRENEPVRTPYSPQLVVDMPSNADSMNTGVVPTNDGWKVCMETTRSTSDAVAANTLIQDIQNALGYGQYENAVPNVSEAIRLLASSPLVTDLGTTVTSSEYVPGSVIPPDNGVPVHTFRITYQGEIKYQDGTFMPRGTDYVFRESDKKLIRISSWLDDPSKWNEGRFTMDILQDDVVSLASLTSDPFDPIAQGLVFAPDEEEPVEMGTVINISLPEDGCYAVDRATLTPVKIPGKTLEDFGEIE